MSLLSFFEQPYINFCCKTQNDEYTGGGRIYRLIIVFTIIEIR